MIWFFHLADLDLYQNQDWAHLPGFSKPRLHCLLEAYGRLNNRVDVDLCAQDEELTSSQI